MRRVVPWLAVVGWLGCGGDSSPADPTWIDPFPTTAPHGDDDTAGESSEGSSGDAEESSGSSTGGVPTDFDPSFALAQVDAALAAGVPGLAIAIVYDGEIVMAEGFGDADENGTPADATTLFNMASVTKHITALTLLTERDEGLLTLDTPVPAIFPQFQLGAGFDPASVQVRHLLTHTSGLGDWPTEPYTAGDALVDEFVLNPNQPLWFPPGTVHDYSNRGYTLAGLLAAQLHGGTFADAVQQRVLDPLGMTTATVDAAIAATRTHARGDSEWDGGWVGPEAYVGEWYMPSGGLWASANDLGALVQALANQSAPGFADGTIAELGAPVQPTYEYPGATYGYGLYNDGGDPSSLYHSGSTGGYLADLEVMPAMGFGVAIVVNTNAWEPSQASFAILDHYAGPIPYPEGTDVLDPSTIPGSYDDPWQLGHIDVVEGPNGMQASFTDKGVVRDLEELWTGFYACQHPSEDGELDIQFWPGQDGSATHFVTRAGVAARVQ